MDTEAIKTRLANMARELQSLYGIVNNAEPSLPPEAQQRFDDGICLECQQPIKKGDITKRGCHSGCHRKILRAIKANKYTEFDAVRNGRLAPKGQGGRPPQLTELEKTLKESGVKFGEKKK